VEPEVGRLAGGDLGAGRLADPGDIVAAVAATLGRRGDLCGRTVLVTAGGTREAIDAVRVITNRSSGKQGYAIAAEAASRGAHVVLVTTTDRPAPPGVGEVVPVASAADMEAVVMPRAATADIVVMAAAVADFRPKAPPDRKIKKDEGLPEVILEPTHDFLVDLGHRKPAGQILIGFAAETEDVEANAQRKLRSKDLDLIVANDVSAPGAGFEHDTNEVMIMSADGTSEKLPLMSKADVARAVIDAAVRRLPPTQGATQ
jgi:phosphopantothenoylcysteine decarboxylase / phosphopantothenate---cysteine ligase